MPAALTIQHEAEAPPGHLTEALQLAGVEQTIMRVDLGEELPDPRAFDFVVSLGSDQSVLSADRFEWIPREIAWLREADGHGVPVLGLCFGAQILAKALGGEIIRAPIPEHGWVKLNTDDPELIAPGPWLSWHNDTILPPPGAEVIARTSHSPHAIRIGPHLGTQFHPEATSEIVGYWVAKASRDGVIPIHESGSPPAHLDADNFEAARPRAIDLFTRFFAEALNLNQAERKVVNR
jgi:GMP synthase-like glutamine amidotransferase